MRPASLIGLALVFGLVAATLVLRLSSSRASAGEAVVVVANSAISPGELIAASAVRAVRWPSSSEVPAGALTSVTDAVGRVVRSEVVPGEALLEARLAPKSSKFGLPATIEPGRRAISVRINDAIALPGFAWPGSYVDVLVSASDPSGQAFSKIVLRRIRVLATSADEKSDPKQPRAVSAVTLELSPGDAERLDLARSIGTLSIAMRNEFDAGRPNSNGARINDLISGETLEERANLSKPQASLRLPLATAGRQSQRDRLEAVSSSVQELRGVKEAQH